MRRLKNQFDENDKAGLILFKGPLFSNISQQLTQETEDEITVFMYVFVKCLFDSLHHPLKLPKQVLVLAT